MLKPQLHQQKAASSSWTQRAVVGQADFSNAEGPLGWPPSQQASSHCRRLLQRGEHLYVCNKGLEFR